MTLVILFFISLFLTTAIIGGFLALLLLSHIRDRGIREGIVSWARETKERILLVTSSGDQPQPIANAVEGTPVVTSEVKEDDAFADEEDERRSLAGSIGSTVVASLGTYPNKQVKDDPDASGKCEE